MKSALHALVVFLSLLGTTGCNQNTDRYSSKSGSQDEVCNSANNYLPNNIYGVKLTNQDLKIPLAFNNFQNQEQDYIFTLKEDKLWLKNKRIPSNLFETNITLNQLRNTIQEGFIQDTPSYKVIYSFNDKKYVGMVDFNGLEENGDLNFIISIGTSKGCTSSLRGKAKLVKTSKATFRDSLSGCSLDFVFNDNKLHIKENKCKAFHGATCEFKGTFDKE